MKSRQQWLQILPAITAAGLAYLINYGITLALTPFIIKTAGAEAYGFVSLAVQFAQYAVVITTALNVYGVRYIGIAYHKNEKEEAAVYFSSVFWGNVLLASAIAAAAVVPILFLERLLFVPQEMAGDVKRLFFLIFLNFWFSTVFSVFGCGGYIQNKLVLAGAFKALSYIANGLVLVLVYVLLPPKIYYVGLGMITATLAVGWADVWITKRYTPELRIKRRWVSLGAIKRLVIEGSWASLNSVGNMLNSGLDLLVCNQMLSAMAMGHLAVAKTIHVIVLSLYRIVDQAFIPLFLKSYTMNNRERLLRELKLSMKASGLLANLAFAGFVAMGRAYYRLWIPGQDIEAIYRLTVITLLTCIPTGAVHPLYYIYTLTVKKRFPCIVTVAGGLFNVAGMYILIRYGQMGVSAVVWTTAAVMMVIDFITNPLYMAHVLNLPLLTFYPGIIRNVLSCLVLLMVFQGLSCLYTPHSWFGLVACIAVNGVIGTILHLAVVCGPKGRKGLKGGKGTDVSVY